MNRDAVAGSWVFVRSIEPDNAGDEGMAPASERVLYKCRI
jgi:hypothetical protein